MLTSKEKELIFTYEIKSDEVRGSTYLQPSPHFVKAHRATLNADFLLHTFPHWQH